MRITRLCCKRPKRKTIQFLLVWVLLLALSAWFYILLRPPRNRTFYTGSSNLIPEGVSKAVFLEPKKRTDFGDITNAGTGSLTRGSQNIYEELGSKMLEFSGKQEERNEESYSKPVENTRQTTDYSSDKSLWVSREGKPDFQEQLSFPLRGVLNVHVWQQVCHFKVESLREFILFPEAPSKRRFLKSFYSSESENNFGQRIFGYISPDERGQYQFAISSSGHSELWLSSDETSEELRNIAAIGSRENPVWGDLENYPRFSFQTSEVIFLKENVKYFIEVLHKHSSGKALLEVAWLKPRAANFSTITSEFIWAQINDSHVMDDAVQLSDYKETQVSRDPSLPFVDHQITKDILGYCSYEPSYLIRHQLVRFQGARNTSNTHFASVHPPDTTNNSLPLLENEDIWWRENAVGNTLTDPDVAHKVAEMFMKAMEAKHPGAYELQKIASVEHVIDEKKGDRFLLELQLTDRGTGGSVLLSEHIYKPRGEDSLCYPERFRWSRNTTVNIIVPVRKAARWALYFIRNIAEIARQTGDSNIHVIIVDYESKDIDIEAVLKESSIPRYTVVKVPAEQGFQRAMTLQRGAEVVKDPHSILFLCDLHLKIPPNLISTIRKHCVEGKMAFAPVVKRLRCGYYPNLPFGYWETLGFGLFALFKSDFDHVGGMNVQEFQGWGGEDWELLDRVLMSGLEVERLKIPDFYHFYHPPLGKGNQRVGA